MILHLCFNLFWLFLPPFILYCFNLTCHGTPEFKDDPDIYVYPNLKYVAIELWQVNFLSLLSTRFHVFFDN